MKNELNSADHTNLNRRVRRDVLMLEVRSGGSEDGENARRDRRPGREESLLLCAKEVLCGITDHAER